MAKPHAYYNEFNPEAAAWLRELIKIKLIADGEVDERSITEVQADDVRGFVQCHFFAGIGGWSYALRLAGIHDDYPLWTASLPCQPFSVAGKQLGKDDERHLLPHFTELVKQCKPNRIFGEQVEGAIKHGWLDDLQRTMEAQNYAVGHCVLGAHSVGSYHIRQRLYWVAQSRLSDTDSQRQSGHGEVGRSVHTTTSENWKINRIISNCNNDGSRLEYTRLHELRGWDSIRDSAGETRSAQGGLQGAKHERVWQVADAANASASNGIWSNPNWIYCKDGKYRAIEPSIKPLVAGISKGVVRSSDNSEVFDADNTQEARTMRLKGYGNAIVPQVAALFISAALEVSND
jgi:DNA (cytosine-5)-methyltransferase 1